MKIGIVAAMEEETRALLDVMTEKSIEKRAQQKFYKGRYLSHEIILVQSGIGKVNAALATSLLIDRFGAEIVVNSGVAGGIGEDISVGDLVVSTSCAYQDADNRIFDYDYGQIPQMPARYCAAREVLDSFISLAENQWTIRQGLIVSGDSFIASQEEINRILHYFPDALATEMEGAAVAQTCYQFEIPFLVIRAISDAANEEADISFDEFVEETGRRSGELLIEWMKNI